MPLRERLNEVHPGWWFGWGCVVLGVVYFATLGRYLYYNEGRARIDKLTGARQFWSSREGGWRLSQSAPSTELPVVGTPNPNLPVQ